MHLREASRLVLASALVLSLNSCLLLPVRSAPGLQGIVVDQTTGKPLAGAIVVVRFDGRYDDVLPDREQLGHRETATGPDGRFRVERYLRPGLTVWPHFHSEARVIGVIYEGYRCPPPSTVPASGRVRIALSAALDPADQRGSCRPVSARRGEAAAYMAAWRGLFPAQASAEERENSRQIERVWWNWPPRARTRPSPWPRRRTRRPDASPGPVPTSCCSGSPPPMRTAPSPPRSSRRVAPRWSGRARGHVRTPSTGPPAPRGPAPGAPPWTPTT
jgi:hypothetical protein